MKLSSSVFSLTVAGLAVATPVPDHLDIRADTFWYLHGFGNPNCQGSFLWGYQGTGNTCINVPTQAASVDFGISVTTALEMRNTRNCGIEGASVLAASSDSTANKSSSIVQVIEVKGDSGSVSGRSLQKRMQHTCYNAEAGILAFLITLQG